MVSAKGGKGGEQQVLCRPANSSDRPALSQVLEGIWGADDYVPALLDEWLLSGEGLLAVAVRGGDVVAMGHLAELGSGEWWLEGLRVDPHFQGMSIGSHLHDYFVDRWLARGGGTVRLATSTEKVAVHKMCERTDFVRVAELRGVMASAEQGDHRFAPAEGPSREAALDALVESEPADKRAGLIDLGWRFARLTTERLLQRGVQLWEWGSGRAYLATTTDFLEEPPELALAALAAEDGAALSACVSELPALARDQGMGSVFWLVPTGTSYEELALQFGFSPNSDHGMYIYERQS